MSDTGDRQPPTDPTPDHDPDDVVGFSTPQSLAGHPRAPVAAPPPAPEPEAEPEPQFAPLEPEPFAETPASRTPEAGFGRREPEPGLQAPMGLHAIYALILFAVPTLGVSAAIGLAAVVFRDVPSDPVIASHHVFQLRTLWTAAIAAVAGVILIVINLGVFVLFVLVVWVVVRGAWGVWLLTRGRPVPNPRTWWIR